MVEEKRRTELMDINTHLIQQCANTLMQDREFSGPEIMAYLMGWGNWFESHHYVGILADVIIQALKEKFPGLKAPTVSRETQMLESNDKCSHTITMVSGVITLKEQLHEYMYHGKELTGMSFLTFMLDTYDTKVEQVEGMTSAQQGTGDILQRLYERPPNRRVPYHQGFTRTRCCCIF